MRVFVWALAAATGGLVLVSLGCSSSETLHPALRLEEKDYEKAVTRGQGLLTSGASPYQAYKFVQDVNLRVTSDVIIREAAACWPADEIAFAIANQTATDETSVDKVAKQARRATEQEIKFSVVMQLPKDRDPSTIEFAMHSSTGSDYPPTKVETPTYIRDVSSALDPTAPASAMYGYDVHFPIQGSPGYAPIGPEVASLTLIVKDGKSQAGVDFPLTVRKSPW